MSDEENQVWLQVQTDGFGRTTELMDSDGIKIDGIVNLTVSLGARRLSTITGEFYLNDGSGEGTNPDRLSLLTNGTARKIEVYSPSGKKLRGVCSVELSPIKRDTDAIAKIRFELDHRKMFKPQIETKAA